MDIFFDFVLERTELATFELLIYNGLGELCINAFIEGDIDLLSFEEQKELIYSAYKEEIDSW